MNNVHAVPAMFSHRHNSDRTYDSICHKCFRTIATETAEADLRHHELQHNCITFTQSVKPMLSNTPCAMNGTDG